MKKLFFTALVAVVAVGGSVAQLYKPFSPELLPCEEGITFSCSTNGIDEYTSASTAPNSAPTVDVSEYNYTGF